MIYQESRKILNICLIPADQPMVCQEKTYQGSKRQMKVIIVLPAFNAEKTLARTLQDIPPNTAHEIILVDDASKDETVSEAKKLGITVIQHSANKGYGANQKTCYREALQRGAEIIIMLHPDYQYDSRLLPYMIGIIKDDICDVVFGNRIRTRKEALSGGMPRYKYVANRLLTIIENLILGLNLGETHSGLRAFRREVLERIPWERNSDDFIFDQQIIIQSAALGYRLGDIPVPARYFPEASSINLRRSIIYGIGTLWYLLRYILHKTHICSCHLFIPHDRV